MGRHEQILDLFRNKDYPSNHEIDSKTCSIIVIDPLLDRSNVLGFCKTRSNPSTLNPLFRNSLINSPCPIQFR